MLGFGSLGQFSLGEFGTGPFVQTDWSAKPAKPTSAPNHVVRAIALPLLVLVSTPFVQTDWAQAKPIKPANATAVPYNVNLFSEVPFYSTDRPKTFRVPGLPPGSGPLNLNLFKNPIPFGPFDYNKSVRVRSEPLPPQGMARFNPNLYTNNVPFGPFDWSKGSKQRPQPDHPAYNLALLGTIQAPAAPFALDDFGKAFFPTAAPPQLLPRNTNLFSEVPFVGQTGSKPFDLVGLPAFSPPLNLSLTAVVQSPFYPADYSVSVRLKGSAPDQARRNPLIFSEVPFSQEDWTTSKPVPRFAAPDRPYNVLIFSEVPFSLDDWTAPTKFKTPPPDISRSNLALNGVQVTAPFYQPDWSKPRSASSIAPDQAHTDISKFTNPLPFVQLDWSKPSTVESVPAAPLPLNLSLSAVVQSPFYQTAWPVTVRIQASAVDQVDRNNLVLSEVPFFQSDWPKVFKLAGLPPGSGPLNVNLFSNPYPFAQYDWSKPQQAPNWQGPRSSDFNLSLASAPIAAPFYQLDWSKPVNVSPVRPDQPAPNIALLVTPPPSAPFYQLDWSKPVQVAGLVPAPLPVNLALFPPPEPPPPDIFVPPAPDNTGAGGVRKQRKAKSATAPAIRRGVYISVFDQLEREQKRERLATLRDTTALPAIISPIRETNLPKLNLGISDLYADQIEQAARAMVIAQVKQKQDEEAIVALLFNTSPAVKPKAFTQKQDEDAIAAALLF